MTPEVIDQDVAHEPDVRAPMSDKERKLFAKQEKEQMKREKEAEKQRKKEEEKERKRLEKEKKALQAAEKNAAKQKSKQKGFSKKDPQIEVRERRDSRGSNEIGRDWDHARNVEERGPVTPDRTRKRLSSFEDIKKAADADDQDRPPTPPEPLPIDQRRHDDYDDRSYSDSHSDYDSEEDRKDAVRRDGHHDDEEPEEVSF